MSESDHTYQLLMEHLQSQGHSNAEITQILEHVQRYDETTKADSIMASFADGSLDLDEIVKEALNPPSE